VSARNWPCTSAGISNASANLGLQFDGSLILLGLGGILDCWARPHWCWKCHRHEEKARVQSLNDFIVFGVMAVGSFSSSGLLSAYGWNTVLWVSLLPLVLAVVALALTVPKYMAGRFDLKGQGALATRAHFLLKQIPGAIRHLT
jgi:hypothetical protein